MTLLERLLRGLAAAGVPLCEVCIELPAGAPDPDTLPPEIGAALPLRWSRGGGTLARRFARAMATAGSEPLLALDAASVVDTRLIGHMLRATGGAAFLGGSGASRAAVLRLEGEPLRVEDDDADLVTLAERAVRDGAAKELAQSDFETYIKRLRRDLPAYAIRIPDDAARRNVERFLFASNYKGSTDFLTKHVWPPLVWRMVRPLARWRVHPNWVTAVSIAATFAAVPLFAAGAWIPGLALAYLMSLLDSVDGKLARLTFTSSGIGNVLDHGLDLVHPPIWYLAWGWALGSADPSSAPFQASLWMFGLYVADRPIAGIFRARTGRSIHGFTPLDEKVRTFVSRRNVNLAVFTAALGIGWATGERRVAAIAFYAIVAWQALSLAWHAARLARFWNARAGP